MQYTVEITLHTRKPLAEDALFAVAELGGVAVGQPGGRHLETTVTVDAEDWITAADRAINRIGERIVGAKIIAVDVMTTAEADRRSKEQPQIVGVAEIAELLEVTKQRASVITQRDDFQRQPRNWHLARCGAWGIFRRSSRVGAASLDGRRRRP